MTAQIGRRGFFGRVAGLLAGAAVARPTGFSRVNLGGKLKAAPILSSTWNWQSLNGFGASSSGTLSQPDGAAFWGKFGPQSSMSPIGGLPRYGLLIQEPIPMDEQQVPVPAASEGIRVPGQVSPGSIAAPASASPRGAVALLAELRRDGAVFLEKLAAAQGKVREEFGAAALAEHHALEVAGTLLATGIGHLEAAIVGEGISLERRYEAILIAKFTAALPGILAAARSEAAVLLAAAGATVA